MQGIWVDVLFKYGVSLNEISGRDKLKQLVTECKISIKNCREILIKFEDSNRKNKETVWHKAFRGDKIHYLSDIYISEEEMYKYRDSKRNELKEFERGVLKLEEQLNSVEGSQTLSSIDFEGTELENWSKVQSKFNTIQDQSFVTLSIITSMSDDIKKFHKNLKIFESIDPNQDEKYEAHTYLSNYQQHEEKLEEHKSLKFQMQSHHSEIDQFIEECKSIQIGNAKKIIEVISSLTNKTSDSLVSQAQRLESNWKLLKKNFAYLLKPGEMPEIHDRLVKEFARRYWFEDLLAYKEKELSRLIASENSKRNSFTAKNRTTLPSNHITDLLSHDRIDLKIERSKNIPKVNDIETEEVKAIQEESMKELREKENKDAIISENKLLKAQLKLKDQEIIQLRNSKAEEIER